uniref:Ankyrin repeat domain-containing protein n=1 Tax=Plectus sambesii TaxID=2011161 RepID=A0A914WD20_9BILA
MNQLEFLELCSIGDVDNVRTALSSNFVDVKFIHKINGWTALHWAAKRGHMEIVRLLLAAGFDPSQRNADGKRPIDLTMSPDIENLFMLQGVTRDKEAGIAQAETEAPESDRTTAEFVPNYLKHPQFPHMNSNQPTVAQDTTTTASKEIGSKIGNGSTNLKSGQAKFILIRTSLHGGKEAFKRFTLPANGTFEFFKASVEKEMNLGKIVSILTLPDKVILETADQLAELDNMQKVELVFADQKDELMKSEEKKEALVAKNSSAKSVSAAPSYFLPMAIIFTGLAAVGGFLLFKKWK